MKPDLRARWNYTLCLAVTQTAVSVIRHSHALPAELPIAIVNAWKRKLGTHTKTAGASLPIVRIAASWNRVFTLKTSLRSATNSGG
jgi:hypothetical protein